MRNLLIPTLATLALSAGVVSAQPAPPAAAPQTVPAAVTNVGASINITPKRVYFDRARRTATVFLVNQGNDDVTVDLTFVDRVMFPTGQIMVADDAVKEPNGQALVTSLKSAKDLLQISPRRVTLAPGKGQTVRLRLASAPPENVPELRTHLTVTSIPPRESGTTAQAAAGANQGELSFRVSAVYGLSIPVIVRMGAADARANIENVHVEMINASPDGVAAPHMTPVAALDLVRLGANSLYGNVEVRGSTQARNAEPLGAARGVAVYEEAGRRVLRIPLTRAPAAGEKLEVTFTDDDTSPGKVLAKASS